MIVLRRLQDSGPASLIAKMTLPLLVAWHTSPVLDPDRGGSKCICEV